MSEQDFEKPALGTIFAFDPGTLRHDDLEPSRRSLLKIAGAGLILGFAPLPRLATGALAATPETFAPNPYLIVAPDNTVTVIIKHLDKGQGAATGLATLVAEELDAEWSQIRTEFAPSDIEKYKNLAFGVQGVGGSTGLANSYEQYRTAGAAARAMLISAAARMWNTTHDKVRVAKGVVSDASGKSATFGELAVRAAAENVPAKVALKDAKDFVYIGKPFPRVDSVAKCTGKAHYTIDQYLPGMLTAVMARPPLFGASVKSSMRQKPRRSTASSMWWRFRAASRFWRRTPGRRSKAATP